MTNIALSQQCAYVWSPKVLRSAMGAHFFCNIISSVELEEIKEKTGAACLVADARGGKDLYEEKWGKDHTLWVFGFDAVDSFGFQSGKPQRCNSGFRLSV